MKTRNILLSTVTLALGAALLLSPNALAADGKTKLNSADARFLQDEAGAGAALVDIAELGEKKAQSEEVKSFAGLLVADHTKANAELVALAAGKDLELSPDAVAKYKNKQEKLEQTSDADFDKAFLVLIINGHEKCVKKFTEASKDAQDSDVKAWAAKMLPGLQAHLEKAEQLSSESTKEGTTSASAERTEPDNTARNVRDRDQDSLTPLDQGNSKTDIDRTAQIRREIIDVKGLSVNAQNVKIITNEGHVTLRGPVDSADEKRIIGEIAIGIATSEHTDNQLEIVSAASVN